MRWGGWVWTTLVVAVFADRVTRPWLAVTVLAATFLVSAAGSVLLIVDAAHLTDFRFIAVELCAGFALLAADPLVFDSSANRQSMAGLWPLVGVLHAAVVVGPLMGGLIGLLVSSGRLVGLLADGTSRFPGGRLMSLLATSVFFALGRGRRRLGGRTAAPGGARGGKHPPREEVARTLHDGVLQTLAVVGRRTAASDPELALMARSTDRDLRAFLAGAQHPVPTDLAAALRAVGDRVASIYDLAVTVNVLDDDLHMRHTEMQALCGAVGEALTNVGKHADTTKAVVFAQREPNGKVFVSIRDNGRGFDAQRATGEGLRRSIFDRIEEQGGQVELSTERGRGTEVRLWM